MEDDRKKESLLAISELIDKQFTVAKYQRGYKWGIEQIRQLLEDVEEFSKSSSVSFYCLQPIIVTPIKNSKPFNWEVIDGQQRLTTIYIILKCLEIQPYNLSYQTRSRSEMFLQTIEKELKEDHVVNLSKDKEAEKMLSILWMDYSKNKPDFDNIDNYHFFSAYYYIKNWLADEKTDVAQFSRTLIEHVKVIWHIIEKEISNRSAEKIFINFNKGKIPLDQADLIKAEFILSIKKEFHNEEIKKLKMQEFATEWNMIENTLQNNEFWFFISNDSSDKKSYNRIDLIFDLIKEKPKNNIDRLYSYNKFCKSGFIDKEWRALTDLFEIIKEWFNNRTTYHLIGFILTYKISDLQKLRKEYGKSDDKHSFNSFLKSIIKKHYADEKGVVDYLKITYNDHHCFQILNLFNIGIEERSDSAFRFPFHKLKQQDWNIEHIHAQNSKEFKTTNDVTGWLEDMESLNAYFDGENEKTTNGDFPSDKISELKISLGIEEMDSDLNTIQRNLISDINERFNDYFEMDNISNLCLLDGPTNKGIGNNPFNEKRKEILKIAEKGRNKYNKLVYVPVGTQRVFSKFYQFEEPNLQMTFWGSQERNKYRIAIKETINELLNAENE